MQEFTVCRFDVTVDGEGRLSLELQGDWVIGNSFPPADRLYAAIENDPPAKRLSFDCRDLGRWDSRLVSFLFNLMSECETRGIHVETAGLPHGVQGLLALAAAVPERTEARKAGRRRSLLERLGNWAIKITTDIGAVLAFTGEATQSLGRALRGKSRFRGQDLLMVIQECGPGALPIVTLISLLVGLILAFVGSLQLRIFGAEIFVANLVGLGMAREMGAMMTAVIMAGRTGAAFAAQLGTMQVNEEIDAYKTMGIPPMDFLVLPRMLALIFMMPLLCLYADFLGILGGLLVGVGMLDLSLVEYYVQTKDAISVADFSAGLIKSAVFGILVALTGCLHGLNCGRSASAVGDAATAAVVSGIVSIVVFDALLTIVYDILEF